MMASALDRLSRRVVSTLLRLVRRGSVCFGVE
jgi:hypothetical protein